MRDLPQDDLCEFIRWAIPEFVTFSNMICQQFLLGGRAINLNLKNTEKVPVKLGYQQFKAFNFPDPNKIGVVFVLKGKCRIYWEVKKFRERHATDHAPMHDSDDPDFAGDQNLNTTSFT